jgi:alpha-glucosidase
MKNRFLYILFAAALFANQSFTQKHVPSVSQSSPDKQLVFYIRPDTAHGVEYSVVYKEKQVINWSPLGLVLFDQNIPGRTARMGQITTGNIDETFDWPFGENAVIHNSYHVLTVPFKQNGITCSIEVRVFNNNLAFRYVVSSQPGFAPVKIVNELTGFNFDRTYTVYRHHTESVITPTSINDLISNTDFPAVLVSHELCISINEAANDGYTKAVIGRGEAANSLSVKFEKDTVKLNSDFQSPWRTLTFSETAIGLCDNSDLLYKLNPPAVTGDYSWIKPGKLIRDMTLTTKGAIDCIDFAAKMNFQYVLFDAGWYGKGYSAEFDQSSNPRHVVPEINMEKVTAYGRQKNIGLVLYVNYVGLRKYDMDSSFALYKSWGVKGLKFGFVNGFTQDGISWLMGAIKKAQDYGFIIDVHDNYKPTGISRTYPALLTQEGVRGNENNPDAFHNTTLPFTRFLSGAADYTFCYRNQNDSFNNTLLSKKLQVSKAQQLALTVIYYSPLQSMLWYGRPADYRLPQETEFFTYVPTVWDKTLHLKGQIGQYITVARKKDDTWYIGSAAGNDPYYASIKLDFLDEGKTYEATFYEDDGQGGIVKTVKEVDSTGTIVIDVAAKGGQAVIIRNR